MSIRKASCQITERLIQELWDSVAIQRDSQLRSGNDLSFEFVLFPTILKLAAGEKWDAVLDAGCGSGVLTERIAEKANRTVGIDLSGVAISLANASRPAKSKTTYVHLSIDGYAKRNRAANFSLVIANMLLMDLKNLSDDLLALHGLLQERGSLVGTITHPCFWPDYWGYSAASWFDYSKEIPIFAPFRISSLPEPIGETLHFHRPLEHYVSAFAKAGFDIEQISEPFPPTSIINQSYLATWKIPRFLAFRCRRR